MARIREAMYRDRESIRAVYLRAFPEGENELIAKLAVNLLSEETSPETFALVSVIDGMVVGHIAFSPITTEINEKWKGYILAPLAVQPEWQKRRIGSELVESGIERLSENGVNVLFVYGDPGYYGKFGFKADAASGYLPPCELQYPFGWQAILLNDGEFASKSTLNVSCVASLRDPGLW